MSAAKTRRAPVINWYLVLVVISLVVLLATLERIGRLPVEIRRNGELPGIYLLVVGSAVVALLVGVVGFAVSRQ